MDFRELVVTTVLVLVLGAIIRRVGQEIPGVNRFVGYL